MDINDDTPPDLYISMKTSWDEEYSGFILHKTEAWWLLRRLMDFTPDGYALVRPADIVSIKRGNAFFQRVCRKEGLAPEAGLPFAIDFHSTRTILTSIQKHCRFVIVDFDYDDKEAALYLGEVQTFTKSSIEMRLVCPDGKWDKGTPALVRYDEISCIRFRCAYLVMFEKYVSVAPHERRH